jgi:hypothetical protein
MSAAFIDAFYSCCKLIFVLSCGRSEAKAAEEQAAKLAEEAKRKAEEEELAAKKKLEDGTV